jgi:hypothetical protein
VGAKTTKQQVVSTIREARDAVLDNRWAEAEVLLNIALAGCRERTKAKPERPVRIRYSSDREHVRLYACGMVLAAFVADDAGVAEIRRIASKYIEDYRGAELVENPWEDWRP